MPKAQFKKRCTFQDEWLNPEIFPDFANWIRKVNTDVHKSYCKLCHSEIDFNIMGVSANRSHAKGVKHIKLVKAQMMTKEIFSKGASTSTPNIQPQNSNDLNSTTPPAIPDERHSISTTQNSMSSYLIKNGVVRAEIIWALNRIDKQISDRPAGDSSELFPLMFPDSAIARQFHMKKDKLGYVISLV